jgi:hypothetical protein
VGRIMSQKKRTYSKETEAAWYALKPFFHPLDCSEKSSYCTRDPDGNILDTISGVYPMNVNYVLASILSGDNQYRAHYMTKSKLSQHLNQMKNLYYRSAYRAVYSIGYGSHASQAQKLLFAQDLGITTRRKPYEGRYYILLVGIDIDAHKNEPDVLSVEQWLKTTYFPESYWESSTSLTGSHGYIKLAYPCTTKISEVTDTIKTLYKLMDLQRIKLGYLAPIDEPCGLPSTISLVDENPYIKEILKDYPSSPEIDRVTQTPIENPSQKQVLGKYIKLNRSQAFKFPRFNHSNQSQCTMEDVISFYNIQFYPFSHIQEMVGTLKKELGLIPAEEDNKSKEEYSLSIVCSPPENTIPQSTSWDSLCDKEFHLEDYWKNKNLRQNVHIQYHQKIEELKMIQDTKRKTGLFYWNYSLYLHRVPSVDEAIAEYIKQGLNSSNEIDSKRRRSRFEYCYHYILERFDVARCGFHLGVWYVNKEAVIHMLQTHMPDYKNIKWKKDSHKQHALNIEELALVYYAIQVSNDCDRNNSDRMIRNSFSYKRIQEVFRTVLGKGCH